MGSRCLFANAAGDEKAIEAGRVDVHQHQVGPSSRKDLERAFAALRYRAHLKARQPFDGGAHRLAKYRLIVDDEHTHRHAPSVSRRRHRCMPASTTSHRWCARPLGSLPWIATGQSHPALSLAAIDILGGIYRGTRATFGTFGDFSCATSCLRTIRK